MKMTKATLRGFSEDTEIYKIDIDSIISANCDGGMEYIVCDNEKQTKDVLSGALDFDDFDRNNASICDYTGNVEILPEDILRKLQDRKDSDCIIGKDCNDILFAIEDECYDFMDIFHYHDGNNYCFTDEVVNIEEIEYEEVEETTPSPAYYFSEKIKIDGNMFEISTSNMSGSHTPYWSHTDED